MANKLDQTFRLIEEIIGEEAIPIVKEIIAGKENVSEFKIAEKLKMTINQLRVIIYKLQEYNLLTSTRKKDKQKGWYIYFWTFNDGQANNLSKTIKKSKISALKRQLDIEHSGDLFSCNKKCVRLTLQKALENDFKCPVCEKVLQKLDNKRYIKEIESQLLTLEQELAEVSA